MGCHEITEDYACCFYDKINMRKNGRVQKPIKIGTSQVKSKVIDALHMCDSDERVENIMQRENIFYHKLCMAKQLPTKRAKRKDEVRNATHVVEANLDSAMEGLLPGRKKSKSVFLNKRDYSH